MPWQPINRANRLQINRHMVHVGQERLYFPRGVVEQYELTKYQRFRILVDWEEEQVAIVFYDRPYVGQEKTRRVPKQRHEKSITIGAKWLPKGDPVRPEPCVSEEFDGFALVFSIARTPTKQENEESIHDA